MYLGSGVWNENDLIFYFVFSSKWFEWPTMAGQAPKEGVSRHVDNSWIFLLFPWSFLFSLSFILFNSVTLISSKVARACRWSCTCWWKGESLILRFRDIFPVDCCFCLVPSVMALEFRFVYLPVSTWIALSISALLLPFVGEGENKTMAASWSVSSSSHFNLRWRIQHFPCIALWTRPINFIFPFHETAC